MPAPFDLKSTVERAPRQPPSFLWRVAILGGAFLGVAAVMMGFVSLAMAAGISGPLLDVVLFGSAPAMLALIILLARRSGRTSLTIGADGIYVQRRFVPYSRIRQLRSERGRLVIEERGRPPLRLRVQMDSATARGAGAAPPTRKGHLQALMARIEEARSAYGKAGTLAPIAALLASAQHYTPDWIAQVRNATHREEYREGSLTPEVLWPVVEDASVAPAERVAAAVALRSGLDAEGQTRLRVAAEATLSPRVRVAMHAALDEDDAQLTQSFVELTGESGARRR